MQTTTGADLIAAERQRQIEAEGYDHEHDDDHRGDEIALAASCYAQPEWERSMRDRGDGVPISWPWDARSWKPHPTNRQRELVKAGALIAAEIDRLQRRDLHHL